MEPAILDRLRAALVARSDLRLALLFGSRARGEARPDSDVDVAVDAPGVDLLALARDLSLAIDAEVDLVRLETAGIPLLDEIVHEGVVLHEDRPGRAAGFHARAITGLETDRAWYARMRDAYLRALAARAGATARAEVI